MKTNVAKLMKALEVAMYNKILARWIAGTITQAQIELLVKTKWLTREEADTILESNKEANNE